MTRRLVRPAAAATVAGVTIRHAMAPNGALVAGLRTALLAAGRDRVGREWAWDGVRSAFTRIYAVHAGHAVVRSGGAELVLEPGRCAVIPAGTAAEYACRRFLDHAWIHGTALLAGGGDLGSLLGPARLIDDPDLHGRITALAGAPRRALAEALAADAAFRGILARLLPARPRPAAEDPVDRVLAHAAAHLGEPLPLAQLARIAGIPAAELRRRFRDRLGTGPVAWLRERRLDAAETMLRTGERTADAVAAACGLGGRSQLARLLRARGTGVRELRRG